MVSKFYSRLAKMLKLIVRKSWELIPTIREVTGEKLVGEALMPPFLNMVKKEVYLTKAYMELYNYTHIRHTCTLLQDKNEWHSQLFFLPWKIIR